MRPWRWCLGSSSIWPAPGRWSASWASTCSAIWIALTVSMRAGKAREIVSLWPGTLELKKIDAKGAEQVLTFVPEKIRFVIDRDFNERVQSPGCASVRRASCSAVSSALEEKLSFSKAFGAALRKARG